MTGIVLNEGRPVFVVTPGDTIGQGPWARLLATAVVPDEGSMRAERGRILSRTGHVHSVVVATGKISAIVIGSGGGEYTTTLTTHPVPPGVWAAVSRSARSAHLLEAAVEGRQQSVHLEHLMVVDWNEPLVPSARSLSHSCTCPDAERGGVCKHVAALGYVIADAIDADPSLLLAWRGCQRVPERQGGLTRQVAASNDPWEAGPLPVPRAVRALPVGAVLKRLRESGLRVDGQDDLTRVLLPAYEAFAASQLTQRS